MSVEKTGYWVKPEILRMLREKSGLQIEEVVQQSQRLKRKHYATIGRQELENWEQGVGSPDLEHLETLSEIYGCPVGHFFLHKLPSPVLPLSYRGLATAKETRLSPLTRQTLQRFVDLSDWMASLLEEHGIAWEVKIQPTAGSSLDRLVAQEQERLGFSQQMRQQWQSPEDALEWWRRQIEEQGVFVFEMKLEATEVRGASRWVRRRYPFILINRQDAEAAPGRLFTLLHEYAHLVTTKQAITCDFRGSAEPLANRFAARLLLPLDEFRRSLQEAGEMRFKENWSDAAIDNLRRPFFVSRDVVAITLQEIGLAPTDFYQKKREQWERRKPWGRPKTRRPLTKRQRKVREFGSSGIRVFLALQQHDALPLMDVASALDMKVEKVLEFLEWARREGIV